MKQNMTTRRLALCGMLIALAMVLSYLEALIPIPLGIPGVKLGLANLVTIIAVYKLKWQDVFLISAARIILSGILFSNMTVILYSMAGALLSILVMLFMKRCRIFGRVGVSIGGGVAHNAGQLVVAFIMLENQNVFYYAPVLILAGCAAGAGIGILAGMILARENS